MLRSAVPVPIAIALILLAASCGSEPAANAPAPAPAPAEAEAAVEDVSSPEWEADMRRFAAADAATPPPAHPVVFTGSSSIRMWESLASDFPGIPILNRGFGGSQVRDAVHHADQIAIRYRARMVLIYSGDNDLNAGRSPAQVLADFRAFVTRLRRDLPDVPIAYISIKPSPARARLLPLMREANALIRDEAARMKNVQFIDVFTPMLGADGRPRPELFLEDMLHMNRAGYELWRGIIAPHLR
jgi:lysophospholipase L1-like esterase